MVRNADGTLHYMINGEDQGIACHNIPSGVFGVIDLYGQVTNLLSDENSFKSLKVVTKSILILVLGGISCSSELSVNLFSHRPTEFSFESTNKFDSPRT